MLIMIKTNHIDSGFLDSYVLSEQPMMCGKCGARTFFDEKRDGTQRHQCLNIDCGYIFLSVEDLSFPQ